MINPPDEQWRPCASIEVWRRRAQLLSQVRAFFAERGVLEVETPILSTAAAVDPQLASFVAFSGSGTRGAAQRFYLHTSPEFAMKRLLAAGSGPIYQICKVFRDGEQGTQHNPEFTLLEWYRPGFDHLKLMQEVETLVASALPGHYRTHPAEQVTYAEAFRRHAGLEDVHAATPAAIHACAEEHGLELQLENEADDRDTWLDMIMGFVVGPRLGKGRLTFVLDYPASQAALARIRPGPPAVAERFELFVEGMELANGFHELADGEEQRRRFQADLAIRAERRLPQPPCDEKLLDALSSGLPDCAGVALGVDRLLMRMLGLAHINDVLAFPVSRA